MRPGWCRGSKIGAPLRRSSDNRWTGMRYPKIQQCDALKSLEEPSWAGESTQTHGTHAD